MKALVLKEIGRLEYCDVPMPCSKPNEVILKVMAAGICGSDISRIFKKGTYHMPMIPGHEFAGEIVEVGNAIDKDLLGRRASVFPLRPCMKCAACMSGEYAVCENYSYYGSRCDGGFAEYVAIDAQNLVLLQDNVTFLEGAMSEPATVALHALRRGLISVGDTVGIAGAGPIGLMLASWANICGAATVVLWDIDKTKVAFGRSLGFNVIDPSDSDVIDSVSCLTSGRMLDLTVEGAGVSQTLAQCLSVTKAEGRVVAMGNPACDMRLSQNDYWNILRKQLTVMGTWNSDHAVFHRDEWRLTSQAISSGRLDVKRFITHKFELSAGMAPFYMMRDKSEFYNKVMYLVH